MVVNVIRPIPKPPVSPRASNPAFFQCKIFDAKSVLDTFYTKILKIMTNVVNIYLMVSIPLNLVTHL